MLYPLNPGMASLSTPTKFTNQHILNIKVLKNNSNYDRKHNIILLLVKKIAKKLGACNYFTVSPFQRLLALPPFPPLQECHPAVVPGILPQYREEHDEALAKTQ